MKNGLSPRISTVRFIPIALVAWTALGVITSQATPDQQSQLWTFDADGPGTLPSEFTIGTLFDRRPAGEWKVLQTDHALSPPHVLGQLMGKGAEHAYKVVLIKGSTSSNLDLEVSLLPVDGKADMGGGLIWHAADDRKPLGAEYSHLSGRQRCPADAKKFRPDNRRSNLAHSPRDDERLSDPSLL